MYLPSFYKVYNEGFYLRAGRYGSFAIPLALWGLFQIKFLKNNVF